MKNKKTYGRKKPPRPSGAPAIVARKRPDTMAADTGLVLHKDLFAVNLSAIRRQNNLSQEELGARLNIPQKTISNWERGRQPNLEGLIKLADFFDVTIDELVGRTDI